MKEPQEQSSGVPQLPSEMPPLDVVPSQAAPPRARLEGPRFIDTVDDDADLTDIGLPPRTQNEVDSKEPESVEFLIKPLLGRHDRLLSIGVGIMSAATLLAAIVSKSWFFAGVLTVLYGAMNTASARFALSLSARVLGLRVGDERDAWTISCVLAAVAMLGAAVPTPLPGGSGGLLIGACFYVLALKRYTGRANREIFIVCMFHFFIALVAFAILSVYASARVATSGG